MLLSTGLLSHVCHGTTTLPPYNGDVLLYAHSCTISACLMHRLSAPTTPEALSTTSTTPQVEKAAGDLGSEALQAC